jgi:Transposase
MRKSRFMDEQIIEILKEDHAGLSAAELCRKHGVSDAMLLPVAGQIVAREQFTFYA